MGICRSSPAKSDKFGSLQRHISKILCFHLQWRGHVTIPAHSQAQDQQAPDQRLELLAVQPQYELGVFKASDGPYWRAIMAHFSKHCPYIDIEIRPNHRYWQYIDIDTWPTPRYWQYIDIDISHTSALNCGPRRPCQNELQKEYCVKIKVIALDWQWVTLRLWCQMNRKGHSSPVKHKVVGKPHKILEKSKIASEKSTLFGHFFVKYF